MSNLFQLSSKVPLYPELSEIIDRIVAILEVRNAATANSFINPRYTISSVFRDLLIPLKLLTKISKSKKLFLPRTFVIGGARREERLIGVFTNRNHLRVLEERRACLVDQKGSPRYSANGCDANSSDVLFDRVLPKSLP